MKLKIKNIFISVSITGIAIILIIFLYSLYRNRKTEKIVRSFLKEEMLNNRILIVRMGYDAVTAIPTREGIVFFDAGISNTLTGIYRKAIEERFGRNDFTYLINTHSHPDHTGGNQVFSDARIIAHDNCSNELTDYLKNTEKTKSRLHGIVSGYEKELDTLDASSDEWKEILSQKIRYQYALKDLVDGHATLLPGKTFHDSLSLNLGDATMNLFYFGRAHSGSDIIIHIPELKLLMTGDLFFPGGKPSFGDYSKADADQWKKAMQWILMRMNDIDIIIGGHGQIMSVKDLDAFRKHVEEKQLKYL
jgi:glyoxylase-like metal-dependent hydrolase (beta-lactamase superfamily II)